jgi:hypothetical protein
MNQQHFFLFFHQGAAVFVVQKWISRRELNNRIPSIHASLTELPRDSLQHANFVDLAQCG